MDYGLDEDDVAVPDGERMRTVLRHVAAYREVCKRVTRSGGRSFLSGVFMLGFWYLLFGGGRGEPYSVLSCIHLGLAVAEIVTGFVNRVLPSAEGVLFDGVVTAGFGVANLVRYYMVLNGMVALPGNPSPVTILFGLMWLYQGVQHVRSYAALRRQFAERPSAAHVRWFEDLLADVRSSDPEADPQALDLPTQPRLKAKLLGDTAVFVLPASGEVIITSRDAVEMESGPPPGPGRLPAGYLTLDGTDIGRFKLHPENWRNYTAWKAERV